MNFSISQIYQSLISLIYIFIGIISIDQFKFQAMRRNNPQSVQKSELNSGVYKNKDMSTTLLSANKNKSAQLKRMPKYYANKCLKSREHNNNNLVFRPVIHELPYNLYRKQNKSSIDKSRQLIRERLIQDSTKAIRRRMEEKLKQKQQQLQLCTFQPIISDFSKHLNTSRTQDKSIHERLFEQAQIINEQRQAARRAKQQKQIKQINDLLNFKLTVNRKNILNTEKHNLKSIEDRIQQIIADKARNRKDLEETIRKQQQISFQPQINQRTRQIYKIKQQRQNLKSNVIERMMSQYQKSKKQKQELIQKVVKQKDKQCTFHPQINQYLNTQPRKYLQSIHKNVCQIDDLYTFTPQINKLSNLIVHHIRGDQDEESQLFRLSQRPILDKKENIKNSQSQIYAGLTFKPTINDISNQIRACPRHHKCQVPQQQTFSFMPQINQNSRLMRTGSLEVGRLKKKKKQIQYKYESEYQLMKQCTFKPKINNKRHNDERSLNQVEGAERFLYLKQKSRQIANQNKRRQQKLFNLQIKYDQRRNKSSIKW